MPDANVADAMKCLCLPSPTSPTATVVDHVRLFRRLPEVEWRSRIHEQILPALHLFLTVIPCGKSICQNTAVGDSANFVSRI